MDYLDLDKLAAAERTITLDGTVHKLREMTVSDFVAASLTAKDLVGRDLTVAEDLELTIKHIVRVIPTLTEDRLNQLSLAQVAALTAFVAGKLDDEMTAHRPEPEAGEAGKGLPAVEAQAEVQAQS